MSEEKKSIRVRIQNDGGTGYSTRITDVETGSPIEGVQQITLLLNPTKEPIKATLTVHSPHVDVVLDAEIEQRCPYCGHSEAWFRHDRQPPMISGYSPEVVHFPKRLEGSMSETAVKAEQTAEERKQAFLEEIRDLPPAIHNWIDSLGWKDEEVISLGIHRPCYPTGTDERGYLTFKPSDCFTVTVERRPSKEGEVPVSTQDAIFGTKDGVLQLV